MLMCPCRAGLAPLLWCLYALVEAGLALLLLLSRRAKKPKQRGKPRFYNGNGGAFDALVSTKQEQRGKPRSMTEGAFNSAAGHPLGTMATAERKQRGKPRFYNVNGNGGCGERAAHYRRAFAEATSASSLEISRRSAAYSARLRLRNCTVALPRWRMPLGVSA